MDKSIDAFITKNSRYVAYAKAHGKTPQEMLDHDRADDRGAEMSRFTQWITERWVEFDRYYYKNRIGKRYDCELWNIPEAYKLFDPWLNQRVEEIVCGYSSVPS